MANYCALCNKKINFFNCYYALEDRLLVCESCSASINRVNSAVGNEERFTSELDEFIKRHKDCTNLREFTDHFNNCQLEILCSEDVKREEAEMPVPAVETVNADIGPFEGQDLVYSIDGIRGKHIDVYRDKAVISSRVTLGSIITDTYANGEKTIYYSDCIGIQFRQSGYVHNGYLQLETASIHGDGSGNFTGENSFTFDETVISNERMTEVSDFIKSRVDDFKSGRAASGSVSAVSVADELIKLKQLLDIGVLTEEEFAAEKSRLLGR